MSTADLGCIVLVLQGWQVAERRRVLENAQCSLRLGAEAVSATRCQQCVAHFSVLHDNHCVVLLRTDDSDGVVTRVHSQTMCVDVAAHAAQ